jgi:hypothetical protein
MDTLETYREAITKIFAEWEKLPRMPSDWQVEGGIDRDRDRYVS